MIENKSANEMKDELEFSARISTGSYIKNNPDKIIVHHTGGTDADPKMDTSNHTFQIVDDYHKKLWGYGSHLGHFIGYHYFIDKTGKITQGRAHFEAGAHTLGQNTTSIGICLAGNFDVTLPTKEQEEALHTLINEIMVAESPSITFDKVYPHRYFSNKSCYGKKLSNTWAREIAERDNFDDLKEEARSIITNIKTETERLETILNRIWQK